MARGPVPDRGWAFWRRRQAEGYRFALTVAVAIVLGVFAVARIIGPVYAYRLRWTWVLGMAALVIAAWAAWSSGSPARRAARLPWLVALATVGVIVLTVFSSLSAARSTAPDASDSSVLADIMPPAVAALPAGKGQVLVRGSLHYQAGAVLWLEREGITARVDYGFDAEAYGEFRVRTQGPLRAILTIGTDEAFDELSDRTDLERVASSRVVGSPERRARIRARLRALNASQRLGRISGARYFRLVARLHTKLGHPVGVFIDRTSAQS